MKTLRLLAVLVVVGAAVAWPVRAVAGSLTVYLGATPDGVATPAGPWSNLSYGSGFGGAFGVSVGDGVGAGWSSTASLAFPAGLTATSVVADRFYAAPAMPAVYQPGFVTSFESVGFPAEVIGCTGHPWDSCYVSRSGDGSVSVGGPSGLALTAQCVAFGGSDPRPRCTAGAHWAARRMTITFADASAPSATLTGGGGELVSGAWLTGATAHLAVTSADVGSGTYRAILRVAGSDVQAVPIDPLDARCADARPGVGGAYEFVASTTSLVPCETAARASTPAFDLTTLGDGTHPGVDLVVEDAAGNRTTVAAAQTLRINAPGGALIDPGTPCTNGTYDASGTCVARAPSSTSAPVLVGDPQAGGTLTTGAGGWADVVGAVYTYAWELCDPDGSGCHVLAGETASSLSVTDALAGGRIRSVVTATTTPGGSTEARSALTPIVLGGGRPGAGGAGGVDDLVAAIPSAGGGGSTVPRGGRAGVDRSPGDLPVPAPGRAGRNGDPYENAPLNLTATLGAGRSVRGYGSTDTISGTLTTEASGHPVRRAQVDVIVHVRRKGAAGTIAGAVTTDASGRFTFAVPAGPSRVYSFGYRLSLADTTYATVTHVPVAIAARVALRAGRTTVRTGAAITLRGTVAGGGAKSRKLVQLQVRHARTWTTFATTRLRNGGFTHRQRFTRTARTTRYAIRARVQRDATWPLETAASKPVVVTVRRRVAARQRPTPAGRRRPAASASAIPTPSTTTTTTTEETR